MDYVNLEQALHIINARNHAKKAIAFEIEFVNLKGEMSHKKRAILAKNADKLTSSIAQKSTGTGTKQKAQKANKNEFLNIGIDLDTHSVFNFYLFAIIKINGKKVKL